MVIEEGRITERLLALIQHFIDRQDGVADEPVVHDDTNQSRRRLRA
jgi:hypothetical protein